MGNIKEVLVPDIGNFSDVDVIDVAVAPGDRVAQEDALITLESDKASIDIPSPYAGVVKEVKLGVGDKVSEGSPILTIEVSTGEAAATPASPVARAEPPAAVAAAPATPAAPAAVAPSVEPSQWKPPPVPAYPAMSEMTTAGVHASPAVRRFARELGADLTKVTGSGPKGRILKEDVQSFVKYELSRPKATPAGAASRCRRCPRSTSASSDRSRAAR